MLNIPAQTICLPRSAKLFHISLKFTKEIPDFYSPGSLRKRTHNGFSHQQHVSALKKTSSNGSPHSKPDTAIPSGLLQNKRWVWRTSLQLLWKITHPSLGSEYPSRQVIFNMALKLFQFIKEYNTFETLYFYFLPFTGRQQPPFFWDGTRARESSHKAGFLTGNVVPAVTPSLLNTVDDTWPSGPESGNGEKSPPYILSLISCIMQPAKEQWFNPCRHMEQTGWRQ